MSNIELDEIDKKLTRLFPGRVVKKDLVKDLKVGFTIPVFVLEYLLGKYCSTTDEKEIENGLIQVKNAIAERIVSGDQSELIKARLERFGSAKLIDLVSVTFDERSGKYWAHLATAGLGFVNISPDIVYRNERLLTGGVWSNIELLYDETIMHGASMRPFVISRLSPIQVASANLEEYIRGRIEFTKDEWITVLLRSLGYEPTNEDFTERRKLLYLLRVIPMIERNYNLIELGPRGTGKSFIYREISPYVILLSGGQGSIPDLFGWKNRRDKPGLVLKYDVVAFDEVSGPSFRDESAKQMYKGYMEQGSFSRGDDKGTLSADAGIVFIGNLDSDVETTIRLSHLFSPLPDTIRNDMAFHDRWHAYFPGWEIPYMKPTYFTSHIGFIADYFAEILHTELRKLNYTDNYQQFFELGSHVEERDKRAIVRTVSGFVKLIYPDGNCPKEDMREFLEFAIELRRRVKEQLKRMGGLEYSKTDLSYIDKETGLETIVYCKEPSFTDIIPETTPRPGDVFTVGFDRDEGRYALYRIQTSIIRGKGGLSTLGINKRGVKESAKIAFDLLNMTAKDLGIDHELDNYTYRVQITSPMQGTDSTDLGVGVYLSIISAILNKPLPPQMVVLGDMNIHGEVGTIEGLESKLKIAYESGARSILAPINDRRELGALPQELLDKLRFAYFQRLQEAVYQIYPSTRKEYPVQTESEPYLILKELENNLREVIERELSQLSSNWWKERVTKDVRDNAEDRMNGKQKTWPWMEEDDLSPIHWINFPEYRKIITKRDNWKEAFQKYFIDERNISTKLEELEPIRNKVMHMRGEVTPTELDRLRMYSRDIKNCLNK